MGDKTEIGWTDATWNPTRGCSRVSAGCMNCYAERVAGRFSGPGQPYEGLVTVGSRHSETGAITTGTRARWNGTVRIVPEHLTDPLRWRRPRMIFVNSMSDLFHDALADEQIDRVFGVMAACEFLGRDAAPGHTFQILTKRPQRMLAYLSQDRRRQWAAQAVTYGGGRDPDGLHDQIAHRASRSLPHVWLGVSAEDQAAADERIPLLLQTPAAIRLVSYEPALGPIDFDAIQIPGERGGLRFSALRRQHDDRFGSTDTTLDWIIAGAESGPGARPAQVEWYRSVRDQCAAAGAAFFLKQAAFSLVDVVFGEHGISSAPGSKRKGAIIAAPLLDGVQHLAFPTVAR